MYIRRLWFSVFSFWRRERSRASKVWRVNFQRASFLSCNNNRFDQRSTRATRWYPRLLSCIIIVFSITALHELNSRDQRQWVTTLATFDISPTVVATAIQPAIPFSIEKKVIREGSSAPSKKQAFRQDAAIPTSTHIFLLQAKAMANKVSSKVVPAVPLLCHITKVSFCGQTSSSKPKTDPKNLKEALAKQLDTKSSLDTRKLNYAAVVRLNVDTEGAGIHNGTSFKLFLILITWRSSYRSFVIWKV
jgi:hypothetical protein